MGMPPPRGVGGDEGRGSWERPAWRGLAGNAPTVAHAPRLPEPKRSPGLRCGYAGCPREDHLPAAIALAPDVGEAQAYRVGLALAGALQRDQATEHGAAGPVAHHLVLHRERLHRGAGRGVVADERGLVLDPAAAVEKHVVVGEQARKRRAVA